MGLNCASDLTPRLKLLQAGVDCREVICDMNTTRQEDTTAVDLVEGIEWPFLISGLWCVLGGAGYLYLGLTPLRMPVHKKEEEQTVRNSSKL